MKELFEELKSQYEIIIIDFPPILSVTDALLLVPSVDLVLLITSCGESHWASLEGVREMLEDVGHQSFGVILNRFDPTIGYGYGYGQSYSYGYGYGYGYGTTD